MIRTLHLNHDGLDLSVLAGLLSPTDCRNLIQIASKLMRPATVSEDITAEEKSHPDRICEMAWPKREEYPLLESISQGIAKLTNIPQENQEPAQILHYTAGGEYKPHFDGFDEKSKALQHGGNRIATLILYLNTVAAGGETAFPELDLKVSAIGACGVYFRNIHADGSRIPCSLHAGVPVVKGDKWIMTTWIRERAYV